MTGSFFLQMLLNGLQLASVYVLIALGFTIIFGILHIINVAHGAIYMLGGYTIWILFGLAGLNYFVALLATMVIVGAIGVIFERIIFRPLKGEVMPTLIASMGLMTILEQSVLIWFGLTEKIVPTPFSGVSHFLGTVFPNQRLAVLFIGAALTVALVLWIQRTKAGLALRAVSLDKDAASLYGINFSRFGCLSFAIGCSLAGAAGALVAPMFYVDPYMGAGPLIKIFIIVIMGGLGSVPGAILAGLVLGFIDSFIATLFDSVLAAIADFAVVIVVLIFKPTGFLGHA